MPLRRAHHDLKTGKQPISSADGSALADPAIVKQAGRSQSGWSSMMKQLILAAIAVLGLGVGNAYAQSFAHEAPPANHAHSTASE
jgi:hypothetical protein